MTKNPLLEVQPAPVIGADSEPAWPKAIDRLDKQTFSALLIHALLKLKNYAEQRK